MSKTFRSVSTSRRAVLLKAPWLALLWSFAVLLFAAARPAEAQDYYFAVPKVQMTVAVNADASTKVEYDFTFRNNVRGHPIDVVDVGTFHSDYDLQNVRASIDGHQLRDIRVSQYVKPGFEVHLGRYTIRPGGTGKLHVEFTMPDMVYQDTTDKSLASLRISPTWFGEKYVDGNTHLQVAIQLPKSVKPEEALHQGREFSLKAVTENGTRVGWDIPIVRFTGKNTFAVSFPKRDMQRVIEQSAIDLLVEWFGESPAAQIVLGVVCLVLLAVAFFRFTGGTGFSVFVIMAAILGFVFYRHPGIHLLAAPTLVMLVILTEWLIARRKSHYMPPIAQIEGGGIKRGLTAPEAAALLELPIAKVLSLVIFGMLKKGVLRQTADDPLAVEVNEAFRLDEKAMPADESQRSKAYRKAALKRGTVIHRYEHPFLFLLQNNPNAPVHKLDFSLPMKLLLENTAERMKGFDLSDTQDYYRSIVSRAVQLASTIGDIQQQEKSIDRNFEWIMMSDDYDPVFRRRPTYRPIWLRGSTFVPVEGGATSAGSGGNTSFGDVAASFSGWAENTMGKMASAIAPGSLSLTDKAGGFLDLSGADHVAGEFFAALDSGGRGGGGGGCACAGCACACACAGGGR